MQTTLNSCVLHLHPLIQVLPETVNGFFVSRIVLGFPFSIQTRLWVNPSCFLLSLFTVSQTTISCSVFTPHALSSYLQLTNRLAAGPCSFLTRSPDASGLENHGSVVLGFVVDWFPPNRHTVVLPQFARSTFMRRTLFFRPQFVSERCFPFVLTNLRLFPCRTPLCYGSKFFLIDNTSFALISIIWMVREPVTDH